MSENQAMNDALRQGFGRSTSRDEERKQSGLKDPADMSDLELLEEGPFLAERQVAVAAETFARFEAKVEEEDADDQDRPGGKKAGEFKANT